MGLKKCPRCELNYILDDGDFCTVCREEVRGARTKDETLVLCSVCGETPALTGEDMCRECLAEIRSIDILSTDRDDGDSTVEATEIDPEPVSSLDEMEAVDDLGDEDIAEEECPDGEDEGDVQQD